MTLGILMLSMLLSAPLNKVSPPLVSEAPRNVYQASFSTAVTARDRTDNAQGRYTLDVPESRPGDSFAMSSQALPHVCYKIRAYIFQIDDDHLPKMLRSTDCGPSQPHTREAVWPQP